MRAGYPEQHRATTPSRTGLSAGHVAFIASGEKRGVHLRPGHRPPGKRCVDPAERDRQWAEQTVFSRSGLYKASQSGEHRSTKKGGKWGGGGPSQFYHTRIQRRLAGRAGHGFRQVPDCGGCGAIDATGFHIVFGGGKDGQVRRYVRFHTRFGRALWR